MNKIKEIVRFLALKGINTSLHFNIEKNDFYLDLNTQAKSHLHLYVDGVIIGRYDYKSFIDLNDPLENIIISLCTEFLKSIHGRDYYNGYWMSLCKEHKLS